MNNPSKIRLYACMCLYFLPLLHTKEDPLASTCISPQVEARRKGENTAFACSKSSTIVCQVQISCSRIVIVIRINCMYPFLLLFSFAFCSASSPSELCSSSLQFYNTKYTEFTRLSFISCLMLRKPFHSMCEHL